jgi:hypothetical protein
MHISYKSHTHVRARTRTQATSDPETHYRVVLGDPLTVTRPAIRNGALLAIIIDTRPERRHHHQHRHYHHQLASSSLYVITYN